MSDAATQAPDGLAPVVDAPVAIDPDAILIDRRMIVFKPYMLCAAVEQAGRARLELPLTEVTHVALQPGTQSVRFRFGFGEAAIEREMGGAELAALLIVYCIGARIPLPTRAAKTVSVTRSGVLLDFVMSFTTAPVWVRPSRRPDRPGMESSRA